MSDESNQLTLEAPVAIIGMACFFPSANGLKGYWRMLSQGIDGIRDVPASHWSAEDYFDEDPRRPDHVYCKRGGFLSPVAFDPAEFGIPPSSLEATDTSQILGLVAAKMALEDAGYGGDKPFDRNRTSVILGVTGTQELVIPLGARLGHPIWRQALADSGISSEQSEEVIRRISDAYVPWRENSFPGLLGNVVAGRISNRLDLNGTNCVVDAACASSMSALHLALLELASGRSDMVITGGVDTINDIFMHMCFAKTHILSPTGDARPFSEFADGTVLGEGIGLMTLRRLSDARRDGDRIYAVIRAVGASSDGRSQSIYAPRVEGQVKALKNAYERAAVDPATVELIEAHGTGTRVGDEVEFKALKEVFGKASDRDHHDSGRFALGSVKSMIGHTKAAAGAAGLIKAALCLHHKILPPTLKADRPDPRLKMEDSPFYLNTRTRPWLGGSRHPRRCGVSAFGFGGSNFHAVLEEYHPHKSQVAWDGSVQIAAFSGADADSVVRDALAFRDRVNQAGSELPAAAANTRNRFSADHRHRLAVVFEAPSQTPAAQPYSFMEWAERLESTGLERLEGDRSGDATLHYGHGPLRGKTVFAFPGQGSQYIDMGRDLACCFPEAFDAIQRFDAAFDGKTGNGQGLGECIYPRSEGNGGPFGRPAERLKQTDLAQPATGAVSMAMTRVLERFGIVPDMVCGHSYGELTALWAAGWIDEDALVQLSILRGHLMAAAGRGDEPEPGAMLAVHAPLEEISRLAADISSDLVLANLNSPRQGVLSGPLRAIEAAESVCRQKSYRNVRLPVSTAFHSPLMRAARQPFSEFLESIRIRPTEIPVFANTTGQPYPAEAKQVRGMLADHLVRPVNFVSQIENLYQAGARRFVEIGPKSVLTSLIGAILEHREIMTCALDSTAGRRHGVRDLAEVLCSLAAQGVSVGLRHWEDIPVGRQAPRMEIPVCGANIRPVRNGSGCNAPEREVKARHAGQPDATDPLGTRSDFPRSAEGRKDDLTAVSLQQDAMKKKDARDSVFFDDHISEALQAVNEGLKTMQAMQLQTADAHRKFLDCQTEANRAVQELIRRTRQLFDGTGDPTPSLPEVHGDRPQTAIAEKALPSAGAPNFPEAGEAVSGMQAGRATTGLVPPPPEGGVAQAPPDPHATGNPDIEKALLEVVSELTGYPVETLGMEMDIEADLGIDSIKRVEILSSLEERLPGLPAVAPEDLGDLKTLAHIAAYLSLSPSDAETNASAGAPVEGTDPRDDRLPEGQESPEIAGVLLEVVSELTGYPVETLGMEMDIEADLGIDSIKRVEILSSLEERLPGLPAVAPEDLGDLKTLAHIAAYLGKGLTGHSAIDIHETKNKTKTINNEYDNNVLNEVSSDVLAGNIERYTITVEPLSRETSQPLEVPKGRKVFITDDRSGLSEALAEELGARGINTVLISTDILRHRQTLPSPGGLILVLPPDADATRESLLQCFGLARHLASGLVDSAEKGGALFASVTRIDGAFGFDSSRVTLPLQGGVVGLVKTAAQEWPAVHCRAVDVAPDWTGLPDIARAVVTELLDPDRKGPVEVGLKADGRYGLKLVPCPYPSARKILPAVTADDVFVISGGARGVTAEAALTLAQVSRPTLILLGRGPHPTAEPDWMEGLDNAAAIKQAIVAHEFSNRVASPREIQASYDSHMANREIARNLQRLRSTGATVAYVPVDVRHREKLTEILEEVRATHGAITGIVHGAGVLEDRMIVDKTDAQFETVFDTKVGGLEALLAGAAKDPLRYLVLFSSVTARFGNRGQADYAVANEVLNKVARREAGARPDCRVVSINWGPWDGGMVSGDLKIAFQKRGIDLIAPELGSRCMLYEMTPEAGDAVEVVVGSRLNETTEVSRVDSPSERSPAPHHMTFTREIALRNHPILSSHCLNNIPVVPLALIAEWFGHGALHENPGLFFHGLDDMRVLNGLKLETERKVIRMMAGRARRNGSHYEVDLELRDGALNGVDRLHSRATAILVESINTAPAPPAAANLDANEYGRSLDDVYREILFHGDPLQGIREVIHFSPQAMVARVASAPPPDQWIVEPLRSRWITDPLVIDCAFQMASLWCYEETGSVSLPSYAASYRQYCASFPADDDVRVLMEIREAASHRMSADFTFLDSRSQVLAQLTGYEAVMDDSLMRAFKPRFAANA